MAIELIERLAVERGDEERAVFELLPLLEEPARENDGFLELPLVEVQVRLGGVEGGEARRIGLGETLADGAGLFAGLERLDHLPLGLVREGRLQVEQAELRIGDGAELAAQLDAFAIGVERLVELTRLGSRRADEVVRLREDRIGEELVLRVDLHDALAPGAGGGGRAGGELGVGQVNQGQRQVLEVLRRLRLQQLDRLAQARQRLGVLAGGERDAAEVGFQTGFEQMVDAPRILLGGRELQRLLELRRRLIETLQLPEPHRRRDGRIGRLVLEDEIVGLGRELAVRLGLVRFLAALMDAGEVGMQIADRQRVADLLLESESVDQVALGVGAGRLGTAREDPAIERVALGVGVAANFGGAEQAGEAVDGGRVLPLADVAFGEGPFEAALVGGAETSLIERRPRLLLERIPVAFGDVGSAELLVRLSEKPGRVQTVDRIQRRRRDRLGKKLLRFGVMRQARVRGADLIPAASPAAAHPSTARTSPSCLSPMLTASSGRFQRL